MTMVDNGENYSNTVGKKNPEQAVDVNPETGFVYDDGYNHWSPEAGGYISNETGKLVGTTPKYLKK